MSETNNAGPKHIFLFILDAVRKDHVGLYGYERQTTPNIDRLGDRADVYEWAFAPSSYTHVSVPSILTGKSPLDLSHLMIGCEFYVRGEFNETDFENIRELQSQGYKTAFFTANIVSSSRCTNLATFFDYFWDELTEEHSNWKGVFYQKADKVLAAVKDFVEKNKEEKLFVAIHLMEAHGPYMPGTPSIFKGDRLFHADKRTITRVASNMAAGLTYQLLQKERVASRYMLINSILGPNGEIEDYERNVNEYIAQYDMGIYTLDKYLGDFFEFLDGHGIFDGSQIMITSDHGELLGEENIFFMHGIFCHPYLTNVALVIKKPNQTEGNVIETNYSLIDIVPSLLGKQASSVAYSFHPKSLAVAKDNLYFLFHNGDFNASVTHGECIFPARNFTLDEILENYEKLEIVPYSKIFEMKNHGFVEVQCQESADLLLGFLGGQKGIHRSIKGDVETIKGHLERTKTELAETQHKLEAQNQALLHEQYQVAKLRGHLEREQHRVAELNRVLAHEQDQTAALRDILDNIKASLAWRIATRYSSLRDFILPSASLRRRMYDHLSGKIKSRLRRPS